MSSLSYTSNTSSEDSMDWADSIMNFAEIPESALPAPIDTAVDEIDLMIQQTISELDQTAKVEQSPRSLAKGKRPVAEDGNSFASPKSPPFSEKAPILVGGSSGGGQASLLFASPKPKRAYTKRKVGYWKSLSQPLVTGDDLAVDLGPVIQTTPKERISISLDIAPLPPTKRQASGREGCGSGYGLGQARSMPFRDSLKANRPDIVEAQNLLQAFSEHIDSLDNDDYSDPVNVDLTHSAPPRLSTEFWRAMGPDSQSHAIPRRRRGAARLRRPLIQHRPLTRSMSKVQKVQVHVKHFSPYDEPQLPHPAAEYMMGELVEICECPFTKSPIVRASFKGFTYPQEFPANQVFISPPASLLPKVEYVPGCVCCKPEGEEDLPDESSTGDSDFTSESDPIPATVMEAMIEADREWEDLTVDEEMMLQNTEEHFRYYATLPFDKKWHDVHWMRDYKGSFGTRREWLGADEIGVPTVPRPKSPVEIFDQFITKSTWIRIVKETNRYARQKERKGWYPVTVAELRCWLGICIYMGIKKLPEMAMHWNKSHPMLVTHFFSDLMPRDRWLDIMAMIHLVDNSKITVDKESPAYDKIIKVRWLIDEVCSRFRAFKPVDRFLSVDEMMVRCLARMCPVKQYNKDKPISHGIKVWALVSASTKYIYALEVFTGAQSGPGQVPLVKTPQKTPEEKSVYKVVMQLMNFVPSGLGHVVTMDNYFTGVPLFADLLDRKIYCTGTTRPGIVGWPTSMAWNKKQKGSRGDLNWRMHSSREMGCCVWFDKKPVGVLSSFALPWEAGVTVNRREGATVATYPTSPSLLSYVKLMRGVDVADQIRGGYSISCRGRRWYKRLVFFIIDSAVCNSWVVGNQMYKGASKEEWPYFNHMSFNIGLADGLVAEWRGQKNREKSFSICGPSGKVAHGPYRSPNLYRNCSECSRRTHWRCLVCDRGPFLCVSGGRQCYQAFHQKKKIYS